MVEQNNPQDVTKEKIYSYQEDIERGLVSFNYKNKTRSLPDLIRQIDENEPYIMSPLETNTYIAIREGLQIFNAMADMLSEKTGLRKMLSSTSTEVPPSQQEITKYKDFCYNFAAYIASMYVVKKMDSVLPPEVDEKAKKEGLEEMSALKLDTTRSPDNIMGQLTVPMLDGLVNHVDGGRKFFKKGHDFPLYARNVFAKYAELTKAKKDDHPTLDKHINGYRWRIMDDYISIENWEDKGIPVIRATEQKQSFRPITPKEIVGNQSSKRKITRYTERLVLYDPKQRMNPILAMGGLAWSVLLDGPPGTGKSSMFRLAMTILKERCGQLGLPFYIFTIDPSIKDEYYGKTGKILLERLAVTKDQSALSLGIWDDLDLLTTTRREAQGADNDINNISMQYYDGVYTLPLGNVINFAATNKPTGLDNAFRNRFNDRMLVEGPLTAEDFADILMLECSNMIKNKKLIIEPGKGYVPFATQDIKDEKGKWTATDVASYMAEKFERYKKASIIDFGKFMAELKRQNPTITGRSAKAITESIKERCADFEIPEIWFNKRAEFFEQPYERKVKMLGELYKPITPQILFEEAQRYADSEARYARKEAEEEIERGYNTRIWNIQAEIKLIEDQLARGVNCDLGRLGFLKSELNKSIEESKETIRKAYIKAAEQEAKEREKGVR